MFNTTFVVNVWYNILEDNVWHNNLVDDVWCNTLVDNVWQYNSLVDNVWYNTLVDNVWCSILVDTMWSLIMLTKPPSTVYRGPTSTRKASFESSLVISSVTIPLCRSYSEP